MTDPIPIMLAAEDELSEAVMRRMLVQSKRPFAAGPCLRRGGKSYLRGIVNGLNQAAPQTPFFLLTDLNADECAPLLIRNWLRGQRHPNLLFRVAVREVEAWIPAHRQAFAEFASIPVDRVPRDVDAIVDAKEFLVRLARRSRKRAIREDIVPKAGSTARIGPNYNGRLCEFVTRHWDVYAAQHHSSSLRRTMAAIQDFAPTWVGKGKGPSEKPHNGNTQQLGTIPNK
jgi:hypothetical protein